MRRLPGSAAPWILWLIGLGAAFHPALASGFERLQITEGDPRLIHYVLEHTYAWATGEAEYWSPPIYHPARDVAAYTDTMLGSAPLYWAWRTVGVSSGAAFQLWMMACFSLTFLCAYRLLLRLGPLASWAAALGAFLFAFAITRLSNFSSPQLFPIFYSVLALHALVRVLEDGPESDEPRTRWVVLFFAACVLQLWSSFYPAFFLALGLFVALCLGLVASEGRARIVQAVKRYRTALLVCAALSVALIWPMASAHREATEALGFRGYEEVQEGLPEWRSWIFPGRASLLYRPITTRGHFPFRSAASQHSSGLGFVTLGICLVGCVRYRRRLAVRILAGTALLLILLSTRVPWLAGDVSGWKLVYEWFPGGQAVRYPARIGMFLPLVSALAVGLVCRDLWQRRSTWAAILVAMVCMLEQVQSLKSTDDAAYRKAVHRIATRIDPRCDAFLMIVDVELEDLRRVRRSPSSRVSHLAAMWAGLERDVPTVNGAYGNQPPGWTIFSVDVADQGKNERVMRSLRRWCRRSGLEEDDVCIVRIPASWLPWLFEKPS